MKAPKAFEPFKSDDTFKSLKDRSWKVKAPGADGILDSFFDMKRLQLIAYYNKLTLEDTPTD